MFRTFITAAALVLAALSGSAQAQDRVQAGSLTCDVSAGIGLIIGSQRNVSCTFTPSSPGPIEYYTGTISKLGLDIGVTTGGVMVWLVFAPTNRPVGALQGSYAGASAEASVVAGPRRQCAGRRIEPAPSRCSRSRCRARSASTSRPASPASTCAGCADATTFPQLDSYSGHPAAAAGWLFVGRSSAAGTAAPRPNVAAPCQSPRFPETILTRPPDLRPEVWRWQAMADARGPRCIALVGPFQSGKTTLLEAILARTGAIQRQGTVEAGTTVGDASKEARHHKMSVEVSVATTNFMGDDLHLHRLPRLGRVRPRHARGAAGGRRRGRGVRGGREEGPAAAARSCASSKT